MDNQHEASPSPFPVPIYTPEWFTTIRSLETPKSVENLEGLWKQMFRKQSYAWLKHKQTTPEQKEKFYHLFDALVFDQVDRQDYMYRIDQIIEETDPIILYGMVRALHVKLHMKELDASAKSFKEHTKFSVPASEMRKGPITSSKYLKNLLSTDTILESQLILKSFLDLLSQLEQQHPNLSSEDLLLQYESQINRISLRLVSTVHPNETERSSNLKHYSNILQKYLDWTRGYESIMISASDTSEYRIRREYLNNLRREIKAELEAVWQADQLRHDPITVASEGKRLLERYKQIFKAYPVVIKMIKRLAKEAYYLCYASKLTTNEAFMTHFKKILSQFKNNEVHSRSAKLEAIKQTLHALRMNIKLPRIHSTIIGFGTWAGGDRDGNPFVVASFTNQTFLEQKIFVLEQYIEYAKILLDQITPSTYNIHIPPELLRKVSSYAEIFPYLEHIKFFEPYRCLARYILERLQNTYFRTSQLLRNASTTNTPLLSQTLPGPHGYKDALQLQDDLECMYKCLVHNNAKSQARSTVQEWKILVSAFGFHLLGIDFRQISSKNSEALQEYLTILDYPKVNQFSNCKEEEKISFLLQVLQSEAKFIPTVLTHMNSLSRDTFRSLIVFGDAEKIERRCIGKFVISMCTSVSDILVVFVLLKLVGMLRVQQGKLLGSQDVCGLFETIEDLRRAPIIIGSLLRIPLVREYIVTQRQGKLSIMIGYSDSVRDGSALASDAATSKASLELMQLETTLNEEDPSQPIQLVFFRGRGDAIPRGFGGSISKAILSQSVTSVQEDHTEQNRFLRRYLTVGSSLDHLHRIYAAHLTAVLRKSQLLQQNKYQRIFEWLGAFSTIKWNQLVRNEHGKIYFDLLNHYTVLPHLSKSYFASRPVTREGTKYDIEKIRAIPFTLILAQSREFTNAFYGSGTAFELANYFVQHLEETCRHLLCIHSASHSSQKSKHLQILLDKVFVSKEALLESMSDINTVKRENLQLLEQVVSTYENTSVALDQISHILLDLHFSTSSSPISPLQDSSSTPTQSSTPLLQLLQEMYEQYAPFHYSMDNKEAALLIRNKHIIDCYTRDASLEEKALLDDTETEAQLTKKWILQIMQQQELSTKTLHKDLQNLDLDLIHRIQAKFLQLYRNSTKTTTNNEYVPSKEQEELNTMIQMTILALSEGLGFGG